MINEGPKQVTATDMNVQGSEAGIESIGFVHEGVTIEAA